MNSTLSMRGDLQTKVVRAQKPPLSWRIRNVLSWNYLFGLITNFIAGCFSAVTGIPTMTGELAILCIRGDGSKINYGTVGYRVVTTAFVNFLTDQLQAESSAIGDFHYHDSGTGTTAEAAADVDLETPTGDARVAGTQTESAANQYQTVATQSYSGSHAVTEHGIFNAAASGVLLDRSVFAAINVDNGDSIQFTYTLTSNSGG